MPKSGIELDKVWVVQPPGQFGLNFIGFLNRQWVSEFFDGDVVTHLMGLVYSAPVEYAIASVTLFVEFEEGERSILLQLVQLGPMLCGDGGQE